MERLRTSADAAFALQKALLTLIVGGILLAAMVLLVGRGVAQKSITVALTEKSEAALTALGSDLDLPATLVDALNDQIRGVRAIFEFKAVGAVANQAIDPVSLEFFGLNVNSDEITRLTRRLLGRPPPPSATISLACVPGPCDAQAGRATLTLHVDLAAGEQSQRLAFPLPVANPGLRRGLRAAMRHTAERLMELTQPLAASDYFLNQNVNLNSFRQQALESLNQAAGDALAVTDPAPASQCLAKVVYGLSEAFRGDEAAGIAALQAAGHRYAANRDCQVQVQTNLVLVHLNDARCGSPIDTQPSLALAENALGALAKLDPQDLSAPEKLRIAAFKVDLALSRILVADISQAERASLCAFAPGRVQGGGTATDPRPLLTILRDLPATLPIGGDQTQAHQVLAQAESLAPLVFRDSALAARYLVARQIARLSERYAEADRAPHLTFLTRGRAELDMELMIAQARALDMVAQQRLVDSVVGGPAHSVTASPVLFDAVTNTTLNAALVAFENAEHTQVVAPLVEGDSRLEPLVLEGDTLFAANLAEAAADRYARAVQTFTEEDEPDIELPWLARAGARWSALLLNGHSCGDGPETDSTWDQTLARMGATPGADLCALRQDMPLTPAQTAQFGLLSAVYPLVNASLVECLPTVAKAIPLPNLLICLRETGPDAPGTLTTFFRDHSPEWFDTQVEKLAAARRP